MIFVSLNVLGPQNPKHLYASLGSILISSILSDLSSTVAQFLYGCVESIPLDGISYLSYISNHVYLIFIEFFLIIVLIIIIIFIYLFIF